MTGPTTPPPGAPEVEAAPVKKPRNRRLRLWIALGAGVVALLCLGGVGVAVLLYDEETKIERAAPDAVLDNFLGAYLVNRNDDEAALYQCQSNGNFAEIEAFRADILSREQQFSAGISVTWGSFSVTVSGKQAEIVTDLTKATSNGNESVTRPWQFTLTDDDGWRVCGATEFS